MLHIHPLHHITGCTETSGRQWDSESAQVLAYQNRLPRPRSTAAQQKKKTYTDTSDLSDVGIFKWDFFVKQKWHDLYKNEQSLCFLVSCSGICAVCPSVFFDAATKCH